MEASADTLTVGVAGGVSRGTVMAGDLVLAGPIGGDLRMPTVTVRGGMRLTLIITIRILTLIPARRTIIVRMETIISLHQIRIQIPIPIPIPTTILRPGTQTPVPTTKAINRRITIPLRTMTALVRRLSPTTTCAKLPPATTIVTAVRSFPLTA